MSGWMAVIYLAQLFSPAGESDPSVRRDLEVASRHLEMRANARQSVPASAARLALDPRSYRPGQEWWVAAALPRATAVINAPAGGLTIFHFMVTRVGTDATVEVRRDGTKMAILGIGGAGRVTFKERISSAAGLDQFPLTLPHSAAIESPGSAGSGAYAWDRLPEVLEQLGPRIARPDPALLTAIFSEDAFARPLTVVWHRGDPWPRYMSGAAGTAVLLKGAAHALRKRP